MPESLADINYLFGTSIPLQQQTKLYVLLGPALPTSGIVDNVLTNWGHKSFYSLRCNYFPGKRRRQQLFKICRYMTPGMTLEFFWRWRPRLTALLTPLSELPLLSPELVNQTKYGKALDYHFQAVAHCCKKLTWSLALLVKTQLLFEGPHQPCFDQPIRYSLDWYSCWTLVTFVDRC